MANTWFNNDGLMLKYGPTKAVATTAGDYKTFGELREVELTIDLTTLTSSPVIVNDVTFFQAGVKIQQVIVIASTAAVGATATLDIGLQKLDRATEIDYNGIVAALPVGSIDATGEQTTLTPGATYAGVLMGTTTGSDPGYLTANYNTAAFTAGVVRVRIQYYQNSTITQ